MTSLSVIVPTYNGTRFVRVALESVFVQTRLPQEIIIVDDCSHDDTLGVVESLVANSPVPMRTFKLPLNSGGPARPINVGVDAARGELIAVLDQDDVYEPEFLETAAKALSGAPHCTMAFAWAGKYDDVHSGPIVPKMDRQAFEAAGTRHGSHWELPGHYLLETLLDDRRTFIHGFPNFIFRRRDLIAKGGIDEALRIACDLDLLGWLFHRGNAILLPVVGYRRRIHDANVTRNLPQLNLEVAIVTARLLASHPELSADIREAAKQRLAAFAYWFREAQCYNESEHIYRLVAQLGEPRYKSALALLKLQCHQLLAKLLRWEPVETCLTHRIRSGSQGPLQTSPTS